MNEPTYGAWLSHHCNPPCSLERLAEHQKARKRMTKRQLVLDAEAGDEAYIDLRESHDMAEAYYTTLEAHLRSAHGCDHDFAAIADENA